MSAYDKLPLSVQLIVDRKAEALHERDGIPVDEARELIAGRVTHYTTPKPTHGTGH